MDTEIWAPNTNAAGEPTGQLTYIGQRPIREIADEIEQHLRASMIDQDGESVSLWDILDYFHASMVLGRADDAIAGEQAVFPCCRWVSVFAVRGGSEGHYIHVDAVALRTPGTLTYDGDRRLSIFLGKTFDGLDAALAVVACITALFHA